MQALIWGIQKDTHTQNEWNLWISTEYMRGLHTLLYLTLRMPYGKVITYIASEEIEVLGGQGMFPSQ